MFDLESFIRTFSYIGIFAIIFAESGLLIGAVLPGDSLLFVAGFLASQGHLNLAVLILVVFVAAVLGDNVGYQFGKRYGPKVFKRPDSRFFNQDMVERAKDYYNLHGGKTIILSRFTPIIRTFAPILAGVGHMDYKLFAIYNVVGAALWSIGVCTLGYFLGRAIPDIDRYLLPGIAVIILISLAPSAWHYRKNRKSKRSS